MSLLSDFVDDLQTILPGTPINAIVAQPGADGNGVGVTVSDDFADLGFGGCRLNKTTTIQLDVYAGNYGDLMTNKAAIIDRYNGVTRTLGIMPEVTVFKRMSIVFSAESASTLNNTVYRVIITIEAKT